MSQKWPPSKKWNQNHAVVLRYPRSQTTIWKIPSRILDNPKYQIITNFGARLFGTPSFEYIKAQLIHNISSLLIKIKSDPLYWNDFWCLIYSTEIISNKPWYVPKAIVGCQWFETRIVRGTGRDRKMDPHLETNLQFPSPSLSVPRRILILLPRSSRPETTRIILEFR